MTLPDCMIPYEAEPCEGYRRLYAKISAKDAEIARLIDLFSIDGEQHAAAVKEARHEQDTRLAAYKYKISEKEAEIARLREALKLMLDTFQYVNGEKAQTSVAAARAALSGKHEYDIPEYNDLQKEANEARIRADRMALGLPCIADDLRGDMDVVRSHADDIAMLREALKPFAQESLKWGEKDADANLFFFYEHPDGSHDCPLAAFTAADMHRASSVLAGKPEDGK